MEIEEGPPDHGGVGCKFQNTFSDEFTSSLQMVPCQIHYEVMPRGIMVDGEVLCCCCCQKLCMAHVLKRTEFQGGWWR